MLVVVDSVVDRLTDLSSLLDRLPREGRDLIRLLPWKVRLVGVAVVVVLVEEVDEVELLEGGLLLLLEVGEEVGLGLNLRRLPPRDGRLLVDLSVVVVSSSVVVGGSVVVVVVVSSTSDTLESLMSLVLSKTLLTASSSASTAGRDEAEVGD